MNPSSIAPISAFATLPCSWAATLAEGGFVSGVRDLMEVSNSGWLLTAGVIVFCVGMKSIVAIVRSVSQERTRREIAAFIAEGSMTPEQGERLLKSGTTSRNC